MRRSILLCSAALAVLAGLPAAAQSIDYGTFEEMFHEPITTSATGKPQKVSEVPVNMEIVTQDDIRRSGADNIPDVLQFVSGLDFRRSSFNDGEVSIRGYDQPWNPRLLLLVDGRPVYEDFYGDVVWQAIPVQLDEIRQIEIVKGPNSALFGFNAASGVINIVTYDPLYDSTNVLTVRSGTQSLAEGSAVATVPVGKDAGIRLSAGGLRASEFQKTSLPDFLANGMNHPKNGAFNIDGRWLVRPDIELTLQGAAAQDQRNFPADGTPEQDRTTSLRGRLSANTDFGLVDFDVYRNVWKIDYRGLQAQQAVNEADDIRGSDLFKIGPDNSIRLSLEYKYNQASGQFFNGSTIFYSVYSGGGMWDWQINPALSLNNAVRLDYLELGVNGGILPATGLTAASYNGTTLNAVSFNSGLVYTVTPKDVLRFMAGRGFQLPALNDLGQQIALPGNAVDLGQPKLRPTSVLNFEADYDHTVVPIDATLRGAVFVQRNEDLYGYDVALPRVLGANTLSQSANIGASDEGGIEIALKKKSTDADGLRWNLGYQFALVNDHISGGVVSGVYSTFEKGTPRQVVDFGVGYTFGRWEFDALGRWQSKFTDFQIDAGGTYRPMAVSDYVTVNARGGCRVTENLTLSATVDQINQASLYQRAGLPVERRAIFAATARY